MTLQEKLKNKSMNMNINKHDFVRVVIRNREKLEKWFRENKYEMKVGGVTWNPSIDTPEEYRLNWVEIMWGMLGRVVENNTFKQKGITIYIVDNYNFLEEWTELVPESKVKNWS